MKPFWIFDFGFWIGRCKDRIVSFTLAALLCAICSSDAAQEQPKKIPRIGFLSGRSAPSPTNPDPSGDAFRQGLRDLGYIEGKNILVNYRYAEGMLDRITGLMAELVQLKVDVLVSPTGPAIRAAKQATQTIPIVMVVTIDPVATGLVDSLARPGGNITGLTRLTRELSGNGWNCLGSRSQQYHASESFGLPHRVNRRPLMIMRLQHAH